GGRRPRHRSAGSRWRTACREKAGRSWGLRSRGRCDPGSGAAGPTAYLLACPPVALGQFVQRRRGTEVVVVQRRPAGAWDVEEIQVAGEEAGDGGLVGGVEDGAAGAPAPRHLIPQLYGRKRLVVGLLEVPGAQLAPVEAPRRTAHPLRVGQGVLDRQPHV